MEKSAAISIKAQDPDLLTIEMVAQALPLNLRKAATRELVDDLNGAAQDPETARVIRENFISYTKVLGEGRFKTEDYLNAVKYVSFKLMGYTNQESYYRAFPRRYATLKARGVTRSNDPQDQQKERTWPKERSKFIA